MRQILDKSFLLLKSASEAFTPVIGSILLLLITFALVGIVVSSVFNFSGDEAGFQPLVARITLESCKGGLFGIGPMAERAALEKNRMCLYMKEVVLFLWIRLPYVFQDMEIPTVAFLDMGVLLS